MTEGRNSDATADAAGAADAFGANSVGVHALVWTGTWGEDEARQAAEGARACGYDRLEIPLLPAWRIPPPTTRALLAACELAMTGHLSLTDATDIGCGDPEIAHAGEARLREAVETVAAVGGDYLCGTLYGKLGRYGAPPTERGRAEAVSVLRRTADHAAAYGVRLGLEVCNRYETNLLNTAAQALDLLEEIDHPNAYVHLDTCHMNIEEPDMATPVAACGGRLGYVHVSESHRGYPGTGTVDFDAFFGALARIGYGGPITFESLSAAVLTPALAHDLCVWRDPRATPTELAHYARRFIGGQLARHRIRESATVAPPPSARSR